MDLIVALFLLLLLSTPHPRYRRAVFPIPQHRQKSTIPLRKESLSLQDKYKNSPVF